MMKTKHRRGPAVLGGRGFVRARRRGNAVDATDILLGLGVGLAVGAAVAYLSSGGGGGSGVTALRKVIRRGAKDARRTGRRGLRWASARSDDLRDALPLDALRDSLNGYLESAREAIDDAVAHEIKDLRRVVRRQRKRLGL
jgi:gas vesicle protein